ncbi:hypothetical protein niasHT_006617 [Heterodera trifolii]|uniref:Ankyrin repeat protein n=1 Tax=Heterodera trifolii TaxID=157864 RepID=A0ABD2M8A5_9BILA
MATDNESEKVKFLFTLAKSGDVARMRAIFSACDADELKRLLAAEENGETLLDVAAQNDKTEEHAKDGFICKERAGGLTMTIFFVFLMGFHLFIYIFLMENGAVGPTDGTDIITIQLVAMNKISPFWAALLKEQTKLVEIMLEKGQNPNHFGTFIWDEMKQTISPLHFAAQKGNFELCQMLVAKGAEVNQKTKDERGIVPLQMACGSGHLPIVKFFVERVGVDIESIDSNGDTVLVYALLGNKLEIGHFLIASGARTDRTNKFGISPMHICVTKGDLALCKFLVDNGANVNQKTSGGDQLTPLLIACAKGNLQIVKLLVEEGNADIEIANSQGNTALILALLKGKIEIARYLCDKGARTDRPNNDGITPHQLICTFGISLLFSAAANTNSDDHD